MRECLASALQQLAIKRVGLYPRLAVNAHIQGVVILGQQIGEDGDVMEVRLLRSAKPLVDRQAEGAVRQWMALLAGRSQRNLRSIHPHRHIVVLPGSTKVRKERRATSWLPHS
jgi:TonB family protein